MPRYEQLARKTFFPDAKRLAKVIASVTGAAGPHNILSATHSDTATTAATRGDIIIVDSTPQFDALAVGASAEFLRSDGTDPSWSAIGASDLPAHTHAGAGQGGTIDHGALTGRDDDDHSAIYPGLNQAETISGVYTHSANIVLDDGSGDSPSLIWVEGGNAQASIYLDSDATPANSDLTMVLTGNDGNARFVIQTAALGDIFEVTGAGDATVGNNLFVGNIIYRNGDTDTYIDGNDDQWIVNAGGVEFLRFTETTQDVTEFNAAQADVDFIVNTNSLEALNISGADGTSTFAANIVLDDGSGDSPQLQFIGGSNDDTALLFLDDSATANYSDLIAQIPGTTSETYFEVQRSDTQWIFRAYASLDVAVRDDLYVEDQIISFSDTDTLIDIGNGDQIVFQAGGVEFLRFTEAATDELVINEGGADLDTRIETQWHANTLLILGDTGNIGIGTASPTVKFEMHDENAYLDIRMNAHSATHHSILSFLRTRGTQATPTAVQSGDYLGQIMFGGYDGGDYGTQQANIAAFATENWADASNRGCDMRFYTTLDGATSTSERMRIDDDGDVSLGYAAAARAQLDIDQSGTAGAQPVLRLDQGDVSEEFIRFVGTAANGVLTQSIVDYGDESTSTAAVWIKVYVQDDGNQVTDQAYYVLGYTLA